MRTPPLVLPRTDNVACCDLLSSLSRSASSDVSCSSCVSAGDAPLPLGAFGGLQVAEVEMRGTSPSFSPRPAKRRAARVLFPTDDASHGVTEAFLTVGFCWGRAQGGVVLLCDRTPF